MLTNEILAGAGSVRRTETRKGRGTATGNATETVTGTGNAIGRATARGNMTETGTAAMLTGTGAGACRVANVSCKS